VNSTRTPQGYLTAEESLKRRLEKAASKLRDAKTMVIVAQKNFDRILQEVERRAL
jgi:hypothetical protein